MNETFMNLTLDNLDTEHICCAISDKKHQIGVSVKNNGLKNELKKVMFSVNLIKKEKYLLNMLQ